MKKCVSRDINSFSSSLLHEIYKQYRVRSSNSTQQSSRRKRKFMNLSLKASVKWQRALSNFSPTPRSIPDDESDTEALFPNEFETRVEKLFPRRRRCASLLGIAHFEIAFCSLHQQHGGALSIEASFDGFKCS